MKKEVENRFISLFVVMPLIVIGTMYLISETAYAEPDMVEVELPEAVLHPEGLDDNEKLFEGYVNSQFAISANSSKTGRRKARTHLRRDNLNEQEKIVYDNIKEMIVDIADGKREYAAINIPLADLGIESSYTANDLGLETIFDANDLSVVTEEARQAVNSKMQVGLMNVLGAILGDFPYELYWYDKTSGIAFEPPKIIGFNNGEGGALVFDLASKVTFKMYVAAAYSKSGSVQTFYADQTKTSAAKTAAENAKAIVEKYSRLSDIEKLEKYKEEVITLTDYNYDSVEEYALFGIYGDPWQIIWVFDNDPETKVVCEGYSKAFQYLCDLSEFQDATIHCDQATGNMYAENGNGGPHMWNIVAIGDNRYIVDLTNNDTITDDPSHAATTKNDELFLAGANGSFDSGYYLVEWESDDPENPYYIAYYYDEDTLRFFSEEELTISSKSYYKYLQDQDVPPIYVTITLLGDEYHKGGDEVHTLRAGNLDTWIPATEYEVPYDSTVLSVLNKLLIDNGYSGTMKDSNYLSTISKDDGKSLSEKSNGPFSGWMYMISGAHSSRGIAEQKLNDGDDIVFHYTDDYRLEDDDLDVSKAEEVKSLIADISTPVTLADQEKVAAASSKLEKLQNEEELLSKLITKDELQKLKKAESSIEELKNEEARLEKEKEAKKLAQAKAEAISELKNMLVGSVDAKDMESLSQVAMEATIDIENATSVQEVASILSKAKSTIGSLIKDSKSSNSSTGSGGNNGNTKTESGKGDSSDTASKTSVSNINKRIKKITLNSKTVSAKTVDRAIKKAAGSKKYVTTVVLGKKVRKINKNAFSKLRKAKTIIVRSKKLKRRTVKNSLKGSRINKVRVRVGKKTVNKKFVKKYRKIFTKKNCGRKVKVA